MMSHHTPSEKERSRDSDCGGKDGRRGVGERERERERERGVILLTSGENGS